MGGKGVLRADDGAVALFRIRFARFQADGVEGTVGRQPDVRLAFDAVAGAGEVRRVEGQVAEPRLPFGFSIWLASGGVRDGVVRGTTDEFGYRVVEAESTVFDLWANVLHLMGIDHENLTFRCAGRDFRLTDVHGEIWEDVVG